MKYKSMRRQKASAKQQGEHVVSNRWRNKPSQASRDARCEISAETVDIIRSGKYTKCSVEVDLSELISRSLAGTTLFTPNQTLPQAPRSPHSTTAKGRRHPCVVQVTTEGCIGAALRLAADTSSNTRPPPCVLNFASAKNPGGGFLNGAVAQEEDICRKSALYLTLEPQHLLYDTNRRKENAGVYTDHMVFSPAVPVFRDEQDRLLHTPVLVDFISAPAPNKNALPAGSVGATQYNELFMRRMVRVLSVARAHGCTHLVLGAWGCGVFGNDASSVAWMFGRLLASKQFAGAFEHVTFAIYGGGRSFDAFADTLPGCLKGQEFEFMVCSGDAPPSLTNTSAGVCVGDEDENEEGTNDKAEKGL